MCFVAVVEEWKTTQETHRLHEFHEGFKQKTLRKKTVKEMLLWPVQVFVFVLNRPNRDWIDFVRVVCSKKSKYQHHRSAIAFSICLRY